MADAVGDPGGVLGPPELAEQVDAQRDIVGA